MNEEELLKKVKNFSLNTLPTDDIHGYGHTERIYQICVKLGQELNANMLVLKVAAYLHDIGRYSSDSGPHNTNHAEISADMASDYLQRLTFRFSEKNFKHIIHCIQTHSYSNQKPPKTIEAKILSDADKLDALGAIGLYRTICFTSKMNGNLQDVLIHLENKIFKLRDTLFLEQSKKVAQKRLSIIRQFYEEAKAESKSDIL